MYSYITKEEFENKHRKIRNLVEDCRSRKASMTTESYLSNPNKVCQYCGFPDKSVRKRLDPYAYELYEGGDVEVEICDECVASRAMDI